MQKYEKSFKRGEIYFYDSKDYEKEKKYNSELLISLNDGLQRERDGKVMKERFMDTVSYYINVREYTIYGKRAYREERGLSCSGNRERQTAEDNNPL